MKIPILQDLNNELTRLFIAGAKFATNDPRITRLIPQLEKLGERAPAIQKLAQMANHLVTTHEPEAALSDLGVYLNAILNTQGETSNPAMTQSPHNPILDTLPATTAPYSTLIPIVAALTNSGPAREETLKRAHDANRTSDFRLYPYFSKGLHDRHTPITILLTDTIIPSLGKVMIPYLLQDLDINGTKANARRLTILDNLGYDKILPLAEKIIDEGSPDVKLAAIPILGKSPTHEDLLISLSDDRSATIKEAALIGLITMDSTPGKEKMLKTLSSPRFKPAVQAASRCKDPAYTQQIFDLVTSQKQDKQFPEILPALGNKTAPHILDFLASQFKDLSPKDPENRKVHEAINLILFEMEDTPAALSIYQRISNTKAFQQRRHYHNAQGYNTGYFAASYYNKALPLSTPAEIYDTFAAFYEAEMIHHFNLAQSPKLDTRWLKPMIGRQDIDALALLLNTPVEKEVLTYLTKTVKKGRKEGERFSKAVMYLTKHLPAEALGNIAIAVFEALWETTATSPEHRRCIDALEFYIFYRDDIKHKLFHESGQENHIAELAEFYRNNENKLDGYYRRMYRYFK